MMIPNFEITFDIVALLGASIAGAGFIYKHVVIPIIRLTKKIIDSQEKIDKIYTELHVNGGSSIKDAINRIEARLLGVEFKQNLYLLETPQAIWESDKNGRCTSVNRTFCRMVGRTEKELLGMGWLNSIAEHDKERILELWKDSIEQKMEFIGKYEMVNIDGSTFKVDAIAYPMEGPANREVVVGWLGTISIYED